MEEGGELGEEEGEVGEAGDVDEVGWRWGRGWGVQGRGEGDEEREGGGPDLGR